MGVHYNLGVLRKERKLSQERLGDMARLGNPQGAISQIENGSRRPQRETLVRILDALHDYRPLELGERSLLLKSFGYTLSHAPTEAEIASAKNQWRHVYASVPFPAYLTDAAARLWDWNRFAPKLLGMRFGSFETEHLNEVSLVDLMFGQGHKVEVINRGEYMRSLVATLRHEASPYLQEPWYEQLLTDAFRRYPLFERVWRSIEPAELAQNMGQTIPICIKIPDEKEVLNFQLLRNYFVNDERFVVILWMPIDRPTLLRCLSWSIDEGHAF